MSGVTTAVAIAGVVASVGGTVMSVMGQQKQAEAQANAAHYQAQVAENNQRIALWQANDAKKRGQVAEDARRTKTMLQIGTQRAALASSGSDVNEGSSLDIIGDTAMLGEQDALTIRSNAEREAYGYKVNASNAGTSAQMYRAAAADTEANSWIGAGANLLAGASTVSDKWASYKRKELL